MQRLVHMSADLARQVNLMLEDFHGGNAGEPEEVFFLLSYCLSYVLFRLFCYFHALVG